MTGLTGVPGAAGATVLARVAPVPMRGGLGRALLERNLLVARSAWVVVLSGFFEPLFYLLSIGIGVGALVGGLQVGGGHPRTVDYRTFVAPAMLATSAMNAAIAETTFNVFHKLKFSKIYGALLATPVGPRDIAFGEITWALSRGGVYSAAFLVVMAGLGLVSSWWALLALPAALLIGAAFAATGMALTTFMRSWQDFEYVTLVQLPLFLFSATFYPLDTYPGPVRTLVQASPLYQGVDLLRGLTTGALGWSSLGHVAYLAALTGAGLAVAARRLGVLLLR